MVGQLDCPFEADFVRAIFKGNHTLFIGDSLMRGVYKDFVCMIESRDERLLTEEQGKALQEPSIYGDRQVRGLGKLIDIEPFKNDRVAVQAREYHTPDFLLQFHFTTSYDAIATRLDENTDDRDGVRTQRKVLEEYETRAGVLFQRLKLVLPASSAVFVVLMPHVVPERGRFLPRYDGDTFHNKDLLRAFFTKAQSQMAQLARLHGFSVIDLDFLMRSPHLEDLRANDGVHWKPEAQRLMNQAIIAHLVRDFDLKVPPSTSRRWDRLFKDCFDDPDLMCGKYFEAMLTKLNKVPNHVNRDDLPKKEFEDDEENKDKKILPVSGYKPYYVREQDVFQRLTWKRLEPAKREAIGEDIQTMRMTLLIQKNVRLEEQDHPAFESRLSKGQQAPVQPGRRAFPEAGSVLGVKADYQHLEWEDCRPAPEAGASDTSKSVPQSSKRGNGQPWFPAAAMSSSSTSHTSTLSAGLPSDREIELLVDTVRGNPSRNRNASPLPHQPRNKERPSARKIATVSPKTVKTPSPVERLSLTGENVNEASGQMQNPGAVVTGLVAKALPTGNTAPKVKEINVTEEVASFSALTLLEQPDQLDLKTNHLF
ncbi:unnamed protein product, partial [Mesorhabditis spiculigera]